MIMLVAPTSPLSRIQAIANIATGCIYLVSSTGVTGLRDSFAINIQDLVDQIKSYTKTPIIVGFGISTPEHIRQVKALGIKGIVMGSAFVKTLANATSNNLNTTKDLCVDSRKAIDEPISI